MLKIIRLHNLSTNSEIFFRSSLESNLAKCEAKEKSNVPSDHPQPKNYIFKEEIKLSI